MLKLDDFFFVACLNEYKYYSSSYVDINLRNIKHHRQNPHYPLLNLIELGIAYNFFDLVKWVIKHPDFDKQTYLNTEIDFKFIFYSEKFDVDREYFIGKQMVVPQAEGQDQINPEMRTLTDWARFSERNDIVEAIRDLDEILYHNQVLNTLTIQNLR